MTQIQTLSSYKLIDRAPTPVEAIDPSRAIHIVARVSSGLREFILMQDFNHPKDIWLNEVIGAHLEQISDDELFKDVWHFLCKERILMIYADSKEESEKEGGIRK